MNTAVQTYRELLHSLTICPFCNIEENKLLVQHAYAYMTFSIAPYHEDHLLILPNRHVESFMDLSDEEYTEIATLCRLGVKVLKTLGYADVTVLVREGKGSGKSVSHLHYHVIPDVLMQNARQDPMARIVLNLEEQMVVAEKIKNTLLVV